MSSSFQVVDDFPRRLRFLALHEHFHLALLRTNDHGLLAHPPHHVEGAARLPSQGQLERILLQASLDDLS
jgi:hypothetical protein